MDMRNFNKDVFMDIKRKLVEGTLTEGDVKNNKIEVNYLWAFYKTKRYLCENRIMDLEAFTSANFHFFNFIIKSVEHHINPFWNSSDMLEKECINNLIIPISDEENNYAREMINKENSLLDEYNRVLDKLEDLMEYVPDISQFEYKE